MHKFLFLLYRRTEDNLNQELVAGFDNFYLLLLQLYVLDPLDDYLVYFTSTDKIYKPRRNEIDDMVKMHVERI